jgi:hypothetical protein
VRSSQHGPLDKGGLDCELCSRETESFARHNLSHTLDLIHHTPWLDRRYPVFNIAFAFSHTNFYGLLGYGLIWKHPDPKLAAAFHVPRNGPPGSFNLSRGNETSRSRLQAKFTEADAVADLGKTVITTLLLLSEFCALWLQHCLIS